MVDEETLLEKLSELEHDQWMLWSKGVAREVGFRRRRRWKQYWIPYAELTEEAKERDRVWARKIMQVLTEFGLLSDENR